MQKGKKYYFQYKCLRVLLRQIREESGLSQAELAEKLTKPQSYVSKIESGERRLDLVELNLLCQTINISLIEFVTRFNKMIDSQDQS
jgi:transcriptional regulator with XRE-family HTH domain